MEDIRAIYRIFNNLKYEMENNGWVYQWHLGDEPIKVTHKFNPPVTPEEFQLFEKYFPNMKLPSSPQKSSMPFEQDKKALYEAGSFILGKYFSNS